MSDIDDTIRKALSGDDAAFLSGLDEERGLWRQIGDVLGGPLGGWAKLIFVISFIAGMAMLYAGWQVFNAPTGEGRMLWGLLLLGILTMQGFMKDWFFSRMNMLTLLREVKRLQLQVAMLEEKQG